MLRFIKVWAAPAQAAAAAAASIRPNLLAAEQQDEKEAAALFGHWRNVIKIRDNKSNTDWKAASSAVAHVVLKHA